MGGPQPWTWRDASGCSRRRFGEGGDPQPARAKGSPRPRPAKRPGQRVSCCRAITLTGCPTAQPLRTPPAPLRPRKRHFSPRGAGGTATARWLAIGFALQQLQRKSRRAILQSIKFLSPIQQRFAPVRTTAVGQLRTTPGKGELPEPPEGKSLLWGSRWPLPRPTPNPLLPIPC